MPADSPRLNAVSSREPGPGSVACSIDPQPGIDESTALLAISCYIASNMKTTFDLPDTLLEEARRVAASRATTVKALVEAGLRRELRERTRSVPFELRDASFQGRGLRPEMESASWDRLRELAYGARGGGSEE